MAAFGPSVSTITSGALTTSNVLPTTTDGGAQNQISALDLGLGTINIASTVVPASTDLIVFKDVSGNVLGSATLAAILSGSGGIGGSGSTVEFNPANMPCISYVRANDLAGTDGTAVSSWAISAGSTTAFTQATGANQPIIKTGANGINGQKVVRFDGTNDSLATTNGGQALNSTSWYTYALVKFISIVGYETVLGFGNASSGQRRSMFKFATADGTPNAYAFVGQSADVKAANNTIANATVYFLEMWYDIVQDKITLRINGTQVANADPGTLNSFSSDVMSLAVNPSGSEFFNGDMAEAFFCNYVPSSTLLTNLAGYIQRTYGITVAGAVGQADAVAMFSGTNTLSNSVLLQTPSNDAVYTVTQGLRVGGVDIILVGGGELGSGATFSDPALCSVHGILAADYTGGGTSAMHMLSTNAATNVQSIWCKAALGFSAHAYLNYLGGALGAVGAASTNNGPWGGPNGSLYVEAFQASGTGLWGDFREIQSKVGTGIKPRRRIRDDTNAMEFYDLTWAEPSVSGPTTGTQMITGTPAVSVANNGVLSTTIKTGAATTLGLIEIKDYTNGKLGVFALENTALRAVGTNAVQFTTTKDTPVSVNVYAESGIIKVQNTSGGALSITYEYR